MAQQLLAHSTSSDTSHFDAMDNTFSLLDANTLDIPLHSRADFWHDAVNSNLISLDCRVDTQADLICSMRGYAGAPGAVMEVEVCRPMRVKRRLARSADNFCKNSIILNMVLRGSMSVAQADGSCTLDEGDYAICLADEPYDLDIQKAMKIISLRLPFSSLACNHEIMRRFSAVKFNKNAGLAPFVSSYASTLLEQRDLPVLDNVALNSALSIFSSLLSNQLGLLVDADNRQPTIHREKIVGLVKAHIENHIDNSTLNVASIAAAMRISTRYLAKLWEHEGSALSEYITRRRLDRIITAFRQPHLARNSLTEIAFSHGFVNMSHFSKSFKAKYGESPSEYRRHLYN